MDGVSDLIAYVVEYPLAAEAFGAADLLEVALLALAARYPVDPAPGWEERCLARWRKLM